MPHEHDIVRLIEPVEDDGITFPIGTTGTVVSVYKGGEAFAVEVCHARKEPTIIIVHAAQVVVDRSFGGDQPAL